MNIWWIPEGKGLSAAEKIDEASKGDAARLAREYRLAYRGTVWAGRKIDCPLATTSPRR